MIQSEIRKNLKYNIFANLMDGGFFGFAVGIASFVTVIPLFVSTMTDSAVLIGLIPAIHSVGWQLPQVLMAQGVARQRVYKPLMLRMSIHERLPFIGLALIAWFLPQIGLKWGLVLTYIMLIWQGLGGGLSATAWQAMIGKIIPPDWVGTFYGMQSAFNNLLGSIGATIAGLILSSMESPQDFALCFAIAAASLLFSFYWLSTTREPARAPEDVPPPQPNFWAGLGAILRRDGNFRWFLTVRCLTQVAIIGLSFYTVYAVQDHGVDELQVGVFTSLLLAVQIVANPIMGWLGDRWSHRGMMAVGIVCATVSAVLAWLAPSPGWFYPVFILAGIANIANWTMSLAMTLEFGTEADRPAYIAMANSLVAPATILAPFLGGLLADAAGYRATFIASAIGGLITLLVLQIFVRDPRTLTARPAPAPAAD
ncbi:MAG: MFS transporter [Chloroflexi bacterium]|jgi:MFS family permease|nr:MFS transporter [Chloroflexota bacterium]